MLDDLGGAPVPLLRPALIMALLISCFAPFVRGQDEMTFPTDNEIQLLLTQADRAMQQYKPLIDQEELCLGKIGAEAVAKDLLATPHVAAQQSASTGRGESGDLALGAQRAVAVLKSHQHVPGYWLTPYTAGLRFERPGIEMNTFLTAVMIDILNPVEKAAGLGESLQRARHYLCLLYTSPSPRDLSTSRMPSSA